MVIRFEVKSESVASGIKHFCQERFPEFLKKYDHPYIKECLGRNPRRRIHWGSAVSMQFIGDIKHELFMINLLKDVDIKIRYDYCDTNEGGLCIYYFTRSNAVVVQ